MNNNTVNPLSTKDTIVIGFVLLIIVSIISVSLILPVTYVDNLKILGKKEPITVSDTDTIIRNTTFVRISTAILAIISLILLVILLLFDGKKIDTRYAIILSIIIIYASVIAILCSSAGTVFVDTYDKAPTTAPPKV